MEHSAKIWNNKSALAASISIHEEHVAIKKYADYDENRFLTFNGIPIIDEFHSTTTSWPAILLKKYLNNNLDLKSIGGYYNLLLVDHDKVTVCNSLSRTEPIYWTENRDCIVMGNRASLVYALANKTLKFQYNLKALISMTTIGWPAHDLTPFEGVELLDQGHLIQVEKGKLDIKEYKPYAFNELDIENDEHKINELYDELTHDFIKSTKIFKGFTDKITIGLTGGKDSRLAAAFCKEAGIDFSCVTSGGPEDRDVIVAAEIAKILNVEHRSTPRKIIEEVPEIDIFEMLQKQVMQGEGLSSIYDPSYAIRLKPNVQFAGHGGALFKGGYDNLKGKRRPPIENEQMALKFVNNINLHNEAKVLTEASRQTQMEIDQQVVDKFLASTFPNDNFYDYMYTVYREGRGTSISRQASSYGAFQYSPFLNDTAILKAMEIPLELRVNNKLYYNVMYRINPELATPRFADSRWKFEENGPEPGQSLEEWQRKEPMAPTPATQQAKSWRMGYDTYLRGVIKDYLLTNPKSQIFDIVDYKKIETLLNEPGPTNMSLVKSVYGILTAAYLVNNDWYEIKRSKNIIQRLFNR